MPTHTPPSAETLLINENPPVISEKKPIIYAKCIKCPDIGRVCSGPNMLALGIDGVREMVRQWKVFMKLSNDQLAALSNVPKGTVDRFLSSADTDFKYTTVSAIVKGLIRYSGTTDLQPGEHPCPATSSEIRAKIDAADRELQAAQDRCRELEASLLDTKSKWGDRMEAARKDNEARAEYLKKDVRTWKILALILCLGFVSATIMLLAYLFWDVRHPTVGFITY